VRTIDYERLAGHLTGGMAAWLADGDLQTTTAFLTTDRAAVGGLDGLEGTTVRLIGVHTFHLARCADP
jgi:hypothetical protein